MLKMQAKTRKGETDNSKIVYLNGRTGNETKSEMKKD